MSKVAAEYIWVDGYKPTQNLRSKTKIVDGPISDLSSLPDWGFDGSSTLQADGNDSDCMLKPVCFIPFLYSSYVYHSFGLPNKTIIRSFKMAFIQFIRKNCKFEKYKHSYKTQN